jgi:tRNA(Leu) C34 or U34 (ribose-2'-O)-methylase TrmL
MKERGYYGIGVINPKFDENLGSLWRSANVFNASFIYTIERKYKRSRYADTMNTPKHIPLYEYENIENFLAHIPEGCALIAVENSENSQLLTEFTHPERCIYLLGSENKGIPEAVLDKCERIVRIPGITSLNVSIAGSIIMYDRLAKKNHDAKVEMESETENENKNITVKHEVIIDGEVVLADIIVSTRSIKVKLISHFPDFEASGQTLPFFSVKQKKYIENVSLTDYGMSKAEGFISKLLNIGNLTKKEPFKFKEIVDEYYKNIDQINKNADYLNNINFTKEKLTLKARLENKEIDQNEYQNKFLKALNIRHVSYLEILKNLHSDSNKKLEHALGINTAGVDLIKCMKKYFNID